MIEVIIRVVGIMMFLNEWIEEVVRKVEDRIFWIKGVKFLVKK